MCLRDEKTHMQKKSERNCVRACVCFVCSVMGEVQHQHVFCGVFFIFIFVKKLALK